MKYLKQFFGTPKQTAVSIGCIAAVLVVFGAGTAFASNVIARRYSVKEGRQADAAGPVTLDEALAAALADAGLSSQDVTVTKAERDSDHGIFVYDIEFRAGNTEYEYEIYEDTGAVYSKSKETVVIQDGGSLDQAAGSAAGEEVQAEDDLQQQAGQTGNGKQSGSGQGTGSQQTGGQSDMSSQQTGSESGIGSQQTDGQSDTSSQQSDGQQNAGGQSQSGTSTQQGAGTQSSAGQASSGQVSLDAAKEIAVSDAGLTLSDVAFTKAQMDEEDGAAVYEIKFNTQSHKYEYEIYVSNGAIRSKEKEARNGGFAGSSGSDIGLEQAKTIALGHAGCTAAEVQFSKAKMEMEHGSIVYEVEFYKDGMEYEYKIDGATGDILEFDAEMDD